MPTTAVARRIVHISDAAGVKAREVAQLLDTTPETVSRWKSGRVEPQREKLDRLLELEWREFWRRRADDHGLYQP